MNEQERLKNEVKELLTGGKKSLAISKKILYDKSAQQFSIKIPRDLALASSLEPGSEVNLVVNPSEEELNEARQSHFIIYGKEKK